MIKKSIASVLILLILINSVGCYSYSQIKKGDIFEFDEKDEVKITTLDEKIYHLIGVQIQGNIMRGIDKRIDIYPRKVVEIPLEKIAKMEVEKSHVLLILGIVIVAWIVLYLNFGSTGFGE
jgi:hypothetical protein